MRAAVLGLAVLVPLTGCARENPLFGMTGGQTSAGATGDATGADDSVDPSTVTASSSTSDAQSTGGGGTGDADSGTPQACTNGELDPGEECDDDSEYCVDCIESGGIEWTLLYDGGLDEADDRFFAMAWAADRLAVVGRIRLTGQQGAGADAIFGLVDPNLGEFTSEPLVLESADGQNLATSRFFDVVVADDTAYAAGALELAGGGEGQRPAVAAYNIADDPVLTGLYTGFPGREAHAITRYGDELHLALSNFGAEGQGHGTGVLFLPSGQPFSWFSGQSGDEANAITVLGDAVILGGMVASQAFLGVSNGDSAPTPLANLDLIVDGRVQGLLPLENELIVTGFAGSTAREPWIGRYDGQGAEVWSAVLPGGGTAEEFETATLDGAGNIVAIGHIQEPTEGHLMVFSPDGAPMFERIYAFGPETRLSDVLYSASHAALFIAGTQPDDPDDIAGGKDALIMRVAWDL